MKNIYLLSIAFLFTSCMAKVVEKEEPVVATKHDSVLEASKKLHDSIFIYIPNVDKKIEKLHKKIAEDVQNLKSENESLKKEALIVKTVTVRDTIYIKEKTNFWGKKKVSTDSVQSVDSTIVEHEND